MNILVSNINYRTQNESLFNLFSSYGEVASAHIVTDRETGRSRGFGFVEMHNDSEALAAINSINGSEFEGMQLRVNEARPREERAPRRSFSRGNRY